MTTLVRWEPYREMVSLSDVMDRLLSRAFARPFDMMTPFWGATVAMPVDVIETADGFTVTASVPGFEPKELDISLENGALTIRAEHRAEDNENRKDEDEVRWQERYYGRLERCFTPPADVDESKAKAELEHGVLTLTLPKAETAKPKTIKVQAK
jgi:HSP20 family protein